jgi:thiamine biosynthesis protein ThiS
MRMTVRGMKMEIRVNGEKRRCDGPAAVGDLLEALGIQPGLVVVERNLRIVPRERVAEEMIQDGDSLEIIRLVGGG